MRLLFFFPVFLLSIFGGFAQQDANAGAAPVYMQYPLPQFSILLSDSLTWYTKNDLPRRKKTLIMVFSPDCEHCKHETEMIKKKIDDFKNFQIVMVTPMPLHKMNEFYDHYELRKYKNITVGRDTKFFFPNYFKVRFLPFMAIYDSNFRLLKAFEGTPRWDELSGYL